MRAARPVWLVAATIASAGSLGCESFMVDLTVDSTAPVLRRASKSIDSESDVQLAREALPAQIKTIDGFLAASPEQRDLLELTAMAYVQYAFGFLEDDLEALDLPPATDATAAQRKVLVARATNLYDRAYELALRLLALDRKELPGIARAGTADELARAVAKCPKRCAPALNWAGVALASAINLHRDDIGRVADLPKAIVLLERSRQLDPAYYVWSSSLSLAVIYASTGKAAGGDPARAQALFQAVEKQTGGRYLMGRVLYARTYATVTLDRALFDRVLAEVLATPGSIWPEQRLANELALRRAARYAKQAEDFF